MRLLGFLTLSVFASLCYADTAKISFTTLPSTLESPFYGSGDATYNGYSGATIDNIPMQQIICDNYDATTYFPSGPFTFGLSVIGGADWATTVKFTGSETIMNTTGATLDGVANNGTETLTELQAYETAAVIDVELAGLANPSGNAITDYQYALWYLFEPNVAINHNQQSVLFDAASIVTSTSSSNEATTAADAARLLIYTPNPLPSNQEFLGLRAATSSPEPANWLFLAGLSLFALLPRVRKQLLALVSKH